jgi:hypothetical protein
VTEFTATASQTSFSVPSYTVGFIDVYRNGVMLGSADYTATNGTTVVLASGATVGDLVEVISFQVSSVLNAISAAPGSVGTSNIANGVTINFADGSASTPSITNDGDTNTGMFFPAADTIAFAEGGTEVARFDSSGNLGIGTSSPSSKLGIQGGSGQNAYIECGGNGNTLGGTSALFGQNDSSIAYCWNRANAALLFGTNGTEAMRIDSSRNLLVGTTTTNISTSNFGILLNSNGAINNSRNVNGSSAVLQVFGNAGEFRVYGNGTYATVSDARIKENTVDATPKLQDLMNVRIVNYNIIGDDQKQIGVIAQELAQVFPSLVDNGESEEDTKTVRYSVFVPILIKAIQEQQAIITELKARVEALENK